MAAATTTTAPVHHGDSPEETYPMNTNRAEAYYNPSEYYTAARDSYDSQSRPSMNPYERQSVTDEHGWDLPEESQNGCLKAMCSPFVWCLQCFTKGNVNGCYF